MQIVWRKACPPLRQCSSIAQPPLLIFADGRRGILYFSFYFYCRDLLLFWNGLFCFVFLYFIYHNCVLSALHSHHIWVRKKSEMLCICIFHSRFLYSYRTHIWFYRLEEVTWICQNWFIIYKWISLSYLMSFRNWYVDTWNCSWIC